MAGIIGAGDTPIRITRVAAVMSAERSLVVVMSVERSLVAVRAVERSLVAVAAAGAAAAAEAAASAAKKVTLFNCEVRVVSDLVYGAVTRVSRYQHKGSSMEAASVGGLFCYFEL
jgi:hypothetical protein